LVVRAVAERAALRRDALAGRDGRAFLFEDRPERGGGKEHENDRNHLTYQRYNKHRARDEDAEESQPKVKPVEADHDCLS
jgi:hypothetical protein